MKKNHVNTVSVFGLVLAVLLAPSVTAARDLVFYLENVRGTVEYQAKGSKEWSRAHARMPVKPGYSIRTGEDGKVVIRFSPNNFSLIAASSTVTISEAKAEASAKSSKLDILKKDKTKISLKQKDGSMFFLLDGLDKKQKFEVVTPVAVVGVRGTHFASILRVPVDGTYTFRRPSDDGEGEDARDDDGDGIDDNTGEPVDGEGNTVAVFRGASDITPLDETNRPLTLEKGQLAVVSKVDVNLSGKLPSGLISLYRYSVVNVQVTNTDPNTQVRSNEISNSSTGITRLSNLSIGNPSSLYSSLSSFLSGFVSYDSLDSVHPLNGGSMSWRTFSTAEISDYKNTLSP